MLYTPLSLAALHLMAPPLYLDPGSGSIIIQAIIAALLGAGIIVRTQWSRIKKWFGAKPVKPGQQDTGDEDD